MSEVKNGDTIKVHYTGKLTDETIFDSSREREPLEFTVGSGQLIQGFDKAVIGMKAGEATVANIPCAEAYGEPREDMVMSVPKDQLPAEIKPEIGMTLSAGQPDGTQMPVTVIEVADDHIKLDANHPLAGKDLVFDIEVVSVG